MFLGLTMMLISTAVVNAKPPTPSIELPQEVQEQVNTHVQLKNNETGEVITLNPQLLEFKPAQFPGDLNVIAYEVGIPAHYLGINQEETNLWDFLVPSLAHAGSQTVDECDSTASVCSRLSFYYTKTSNYMYAKYYKNKWTKNDSSVSWSNAKLGGWCNAEWYNNPGSRCYQNSYGNIGTPSSGTTYKVTPAFAGSSNKTIVDSLNYQTSYQEVNLQRGASNWTFTFCIDVGGGGMTTGCY